MPDIGYDVDGLRRGAGEHRAFADAVTALGQLLAAINADAGPLGSVPSAGGFVGGIVAARDLQREHVLTEATRRAGLQEHATTTAGLGEHLISLTTAEASGVAPAPFPLLGGGG